MKVGAESFVKLLAQRALQVTAQCSAGPTHSLQQTESLLARMSSPNRRAETYKQEALPTGTNQIHYQYILHLTLD